MGTSQVLGPVLRPATAAEYLGISRAAIYRLVKSGDLPSPVKISVGAAGFPKAALDEFITRCAAKHEAAA